MAKSYARIDVLTATKANIGVVIRRGPTDAYQMLVWDFNTDTVTSGAWIKGKIYTRRCDVSPNGKYVVLFMSGHLERWLRQTPQELEDTCTFISRPPYIFPLGLWFSNGTYGGGGFWEKDSVLHVNTDNSEFREAITPPSNIRVILEDCLSDPDLTLHKFKLIDRGWQPNLNQANLHDRPPDLISKQYLVDAWMKKNPITSDDRIILSVRDYSKKFAAGTLNFHLGNEVVSVLDTGGQEALKLTSQDNHPLWIDVDASGRLIYSDKGCLWAWPDFPGKEPQLIADLNETTFEYIATPDWARGS